MTLASKQKLSITESHFHFHRSAKQIKSRQSCSLSWRVLVCLLPEVSADTCHCHMLSREEISLSIRVDFKVLYWRDCFTDNIAKASMELSKRNSDRQKVAVIKHEMINYNSFSYFSPFFLTTSPGTWPCSKPTCSGHVPHHSESQLGHAPHRQWRDPKLQNLLHGEGHGQ